MALVAAEKVPVQLLPSADAFQRFGASTGQAKSILLDWGNGLVEAIAPVHLPVTKLFVGANEAVALTPPSANAPFPIHIHLYTAKSMTSMDISDGPKKSMFMRISVNEIYKWSCERQHSATKLLIQLANSDSIKFHPKASPAVMGLTTAIQVVAEFLLGNTMYRGR